MLAEAVGADLERLLSALAKPELVTILEDHDWIVDGVSYSVGSARREPKEVLRVLDALQHGGLMPCAWRPGQKPLTVG